MPLTFLHISDIHLKGGDRYDQEVVLRALVASVRRFREEGRQPDLIFMTGDVAHAGKPEQYTLATGFFDDLLAAADLDHNKLFVGRRCLDGPLDELKADRNALRIGLVHHPLDWLSEIERDNVEHSLHEALEVLLHGHLHVTKAHAETFADGKGLLHLAAGAAYQPRKHPNAAHFGTVGDDGALTVHPIRFEDSPQEIWTLDTSRLATEPGYEGRFAVGRSAPAPGRAAVGEVTERAAHRSTIPGRGNLPFVGREALLEQIATRLADPAADGVVVLHGQPGVGKSELAREYGRINHESLEASRRALRELREG